MSGKSAQSLAAIELLTGEPAHVTRPHTPFRERVYDLSDRNRLVADAFALAEMLSTPAPDPKAVRRLACELVFAQKPLFQEISAHDVMVDLFEFLEVPGKQAREQLRASVERWARDAQFYLLTHDHAAAVEYLISFFGDRDYVYALLAITPTQVARWRKGQGTSAATRAAINALVTAIFELTPRLSREEIIDWMDEPNEHLNLTQSTTMLSQPLSLFQRLIVHPSTRYEQERLEHDVRWALHRDFGFPVRR